MFSSKEERGDQMTYCLTNIEYCDFDQYGIEDVPVAAESNYSLFPFEYQHPICRYFQY